MLPDVERRLGRSKNGICEEGHVAGLDSATLPNLFQIQKSGAANRIRTCDPVITNDVLYQLSYCGGPCDAFGNGAENARP